jgi:hypothetical protein
MDMTTELYKKYWQIGCTILDDESGRYVAEIYIDSPPFPEPRRYDFPRFPAADTAAEARSHAVRWAKEWIEKNFITAGSGDEIERP